MKRGYSVPPLCSPLVFSLSALPLYSTLQFSPCVLPFCFPLLLSPFVLPICSPFCFPLVLPPYVSSLYSSLLLPPCVLPCCSPFLVYPPRCCPIGTGAQLRPTGGWRAFPAPCTTAEPCPVSWRRPFAGACSTSTARGESFVCFASMSRDTDVFGLGAAEL